MAVEYFILGNANSAVPEIQEYQIRLCSDGLNTHREKLVKLSNRLMSVDNRNAENVTTRCWFAGYLTPKLYIVALGGEQNSLLKTRYVGTRGLFAVMALGFTGEDIRLYEQSEELFEPLKQILQQINKRCTGSEDVPPAKSPEELNRELKTPAKDALHEHCAKFICQEKAGASTTDKNNILHSEAALDQALWRESRQRMAMLEILTAEDAKTLLDLFPTGVATVLEDLTMNYQPSLKLSAVQQRMVQQQRQNTQKSKQENTARSVEKSNSSAKSIIQQVSNNRPEDENIGSILIKFFRKWYRKLRTNKSSGLIQLSSASALRFADLRNSTASNEFKIIKKTVNIYMSTKGISDDSKQQFLIDYLSFFYIMNDGFPENQEEIILLLDDASKKIPKLLTSQSNKQRCNHYGR